LPDSERTFFENRFGADFGSVRVHTSDAAAQTAQDLDARAYTVGSDIAFNAGEYQPGSEHGRSLLAHELTHVVQQGGAGELKRELQSGQVQREQVDSDETLSSPEVVEEPVEGEAQIEGQQLGAESEKKAVGEGDVGAVEADEKSSVVESSEDARGGSAEAGQPDAEKQLVGKRKASSAGLEKGDQPGKQALTDMSLPAAQDLVPLQGLPVSIDPMTAATEAEAATGQNVVQIEQEAVAAHGQLESAFAESAAEPPPSLADLLEPGPEGVNVELEEPAAPSPVSIDFSGGEASVPAKADLPEVKQPVTSGLGQDVAAVAGDLGSQMGVTAPSELSLASSSVEEIETVMRSPLPSSPSTSVGVQCAEAPAEDGYDPVAARAQVQSMASPLNAAPGQVQQQIQGQAEATKANVTASAQTLQQSIQTRVTQQIADVQSAAAEQRTALKAALENAVIQVDETLATNVEAAQAKGENLKTKLTGLYSTHKTNVQKAVTDHIALTEKLRTDRKAEAGRKIQEKADEARRRGNDKAGGYPGDERGQKQAEAVRKVANETAGEIEGEKPGVENSIVEITQDIPSEFQAKGDEALKGFDDNLPDILKGVDDQVKVIVDNLTEKTQETKQQLQQLGEQLGIQLDTLEQSVLTTLQGIVPQAVTQVTGMVQAALPSIDAGAQEAIGEVVSFVGQATQTLLGIEAPDVGAAQEYVGQVMGFASGAPAEVTPIFQEVDAQLAEQFTQLQTLTDERLLTMEGQTTTQLQTLTERVQAALTELTTTLATAFETVVTSMDEPFSETETRVNDELTGSLTEMTAGFGQTLREADGEIVNAINEGLAKANEALAGLDGKMNEAAAEAAWRYDHPVLAALKDIGGFVAGLVVGILVVLALVVVAIVAFQVIIAALVALGLSSALATLIVTIAGLALLAVGIYMAYQARIEEGQSGLMAFLGALGDIVGITDIINGIQQIREDGHVSFSSGFSIGQGLGKIGAIIFGGRISRAVKARLPNSITHPVQGSAWRWLKGPTQPNTTAGWKVGDPINNLTSKGNVPKWDTVRQRFWKNEANSDKTFWGRLWSRLNGRNYTQSQLERMAGGRAPQRINPITGRLESMELSHTPPQRAGGLFDVEPLWPDEHAIIDAFRHTGHAAPESATQLLDYLAPALADTAAPQLVEEYLIPLFVDMGLMEEEEEEEEESSR
jgi:hypothetical protein